MNSENSENNSILKDLKPLEKIYSKCYKNLDKYFYKTKEFFDNNLFNNKIKINKRNYYHFHSFSSEYKKNKLNKNININNIIFDQFINRIKTIIENDKNKLIKKNNNFEHINESFYIENTKNNNFLDNFLIVKKEKENLKNIEEKKKRELHLFFKEKIEFEKNKQKKIKKLINERHCPGQYHPNYSSIYKKIPFVIFSKFSYRNNNNNNNNNINKTFNKSSLNLNEINNNNKNRIKLKKILISKLKNNKNKINKSFFNNNNNNKLETEDSFIEKINKNNILNLKNKNHSKIKTTSTSSESKKIIKTRNNEKTNSLIKNSLNYSYKIYNKNKSMENYNNKIKIRKKFNNNNNKNIIHSLCFNKMSGRENNNIKNNSPFNLYSPNYNTIQPNIKSVYFGNKNDDDIFKIKKKIVNEKIHYYNQSLDYFILDFKKFENKNNF